MSDVVDSESGLNVERTKPLTSNVVKKTRRAKANKWTDEEDSSSSSSTGTDLMSECDDGSNGNGTDDGEPIDDGTMVNATKGTSRPNKRPSAVYTRKILRETVEDTTEDTAIRFIPTQKGGQNVVFRSYVFTISKHYTATTSYWKCHTKGCKATLVMDSNLFKSTKGVHNHEPDEDKKLQRCEKRRQRLERIKKAKLVREELLKKRAEKKRNDELEMKKKTADRLALGKSGPSKMSDMSVGDILAMTQQSDTFDLCDFDLFDLKLTKWFGRFQQCDEVEGDNHELVTLISEWNIQRQRVRQMASKQMRRRDKRFRLLRNKLETAINEKEVEEAAKVKLESRLASVNTGCQLLLNQLIDIQKHCTDNGETNDNGQQTTNKQHSSTSAGGQEAITNRKLNPTANIQSTDYKALFERTLNERDYIALRLAEQPPGETTHRVVYSAHGPLAVEGHQPSISQGLTGYGVELNSQFINQGLSIPQQSISLSNANHNFVSNGVTSYGSSGNSGSTARLGSNEPQVLLLEGSPAHRIWSNN